MYRALFEAFSRECCLRITRGEPLHPRDARAFALLLDLREAAGHRLLGARAGDDPSFDTVSGRCGVQPAFAELR